MACQPNQPRVQSSYSTNHHYVNTISILCKCLFLCTTFLLVTQVCDTYPADLFVPKSVTLPVIIGSSKFRSRGRFPTLSYYCKENHVSLAAHPAYSFCSLSIHPPLLMRLWRILSCPLYVFACQIFCHWIEESKVQEHSVLET